MKLTTSLLTRGGENDYHTALLHLNAAFAAAGLPFAKASCSGLLVIGKANFWLSVSLSLDKRESWTNGLFENSRSARLSVTIEGDKFVVECFSGGRSVDFPNKPFRKFRVKYLEQVGERIADWALINNLPAHEAAKRLA